MVSIMFCLLILPIENFIVKPTMIATKAMDMIIGITGIEYPKSNADFNEDTEELSETNVNPDETIQEIGDSQSLYKYFEFTPQNSEPNMAPVYSAINEFQSQRHDIDVTRLLKLKYKDKLSINEISAELGLPDETILQLLGEIGYVVKEQ